jgi:GntR family transcriptional regulator
MTARRLLLAISSARPGALYEQIIEGLRREIAEGRLRPGESLPSFRALAEELLVSVITVKRAYEELERDGLIYRRQGLGTFVADAASDRSRHAMRERAADLLRDAVREAVQAGLSPREIGRQVQALLADEGTIAHAKRY